MNNHVLENVTEAKYLGVTISSDLRWSKHVSNTEKKANKVLGFLRRNLRIVSKDTREMAYKSMVRPILEYAATVWDPHTEKDSNSIEKIQRSSDQSTD